MPLSPFVFKPGIDREGTNYIAEGGWYACDKVRFRSGHPQKIGGWQRLGDNAYVGVCRSLTNWITLLGENLVGLGTHLKYYIEVGETMYDITPLRASSTINSNPFATTNGSPIVTVTDTGHGCIDGDFVTFSGATGFANLVADDLNKEFQITYVDGDSYKITLAVTPNATTAGGGAAVVAAYQVNVGLSTFISGTGWGAGGFGRGGWGSGSSIAIGFQLRLWNHGQFGEDLVYGPRGGSLYYWDASTGTGSRGVSLSSLGGASDVPTVHNCLLVSDVSRFVMVFGTNQIGSGTLDPMLVRWSDQEDAVDWTPSPLNQAGDIRLSYGSEIITARQSKQEVLVWTDSGLYSGQYQGPPYVWGFQLVGENLSIAGPNAVAFANNTAFWMGVDKFYVYNGRVQTLPCSLLRYVFNDFNPTQRWQVYAGTSEGFNEVWWFYCSEESDQNDRYVVFNYVENAWYYGSMARSAWLDTALRKYPLASQDGALLYHESGNDDGAALGQAASPITAFIESADFDIEDGHSFAFITKVIPDVTFDGSDAASPSVTVTLTPRNAPGGEYEVPSNAQAKTVTLTGPDRFTEQLHVRLRGRQIKVRWESSSLGTKWQLGKMRLEARKDGRR
jgi:hypothetical protein